jgi:hypothetical protein
MQSPMDLVYRLSLTFEKANLAGVVVDAPQQSL